MPVGRRSRSVARRCAAFARAGQAIASRRKARDFWWMEAATASLPGQRSGSLQTGLRTVSDSNCCPSSSSSHCQRGTLARRRESAGDSGLGLSRSERGGRGREAFSGPVFRPARANVRSPRRPARMADISLRAPATPQGARGAAESRRRRGSRPPQPGARDLTRVNAPAPCKAQERRGPPAGAARAPCSSDTSPRPGPARGHSEAPLFGSLQKLSLYSTRYSVSYVRSEPVRCNNMSNGKQCSLRHI